MKPVSGEMPDRQNLLAFPSGPQGPPGSSGLQVLKIEIFTTPPRCSIVKHELQKISYARLVYVKNVSTSLTSESLAGDKVEPCLPKCAGGPQDSLFNTL